MKIPGQTAERIYTQDESIEWLKDSKKDDIKNGRRWHITSNYNASGRYTACIKVKRGEKINKCYYKH